MPFAALLGLLLFAPPALPPDGVQPSVEDGSASDGAPSEGGSASEAAPSEAAPSEDGAPGSDPAAGPEEGAPTGGEDEAITVGPVDPPDEDDSDDGADDGAGEAVDGAAAGGAAGGSGPTVQQPKPKAQPGQASTPSQPSESAAPSGSPAEAGSVAEPVAEPEPEAQPEEETYRKLGGFRLLRLGIAPKIGYTHGTSDKNGVFDRDKSIQDSIDNGMVTTSGAGDLGKTRFGGFQYGFILDAEVVGINVWLDFHKFFSPGGMWSLLLGYDHEFGFGKRLRLDVGVGGGLNNVFLGDALKDLYYDKSNPQSVNIATLGVEGRAMADLHIKLVGPLFTGPYVMLGYHYLWSANVAEVTVEKGLHYSLGWTLRLDFATPKLIGGKKTRTKRN